MKKTAVRFVAGMLLLGTFLTGNAFAVSVTVPPQLIDAATATPSTVMVGEETTLEIKLGDGYGGGRLSWKQVSGPGTATLTMSPIRIFPPIYTATFDTAGSYVLGVTATESSGFSETRKVTVEVTDGLAATATPSTVAVGEETVLRIIPGEGNGGATYSWEQVSGPGTATLTLSPFDIFPSIYTATFDTAGSYVLEVTAKEAGGSAQTAEVTVEVSSDFVVEITSPRDGYELVTLGIQEPLDVAVRADDPTHGIKEVELTVNGSVIDTRNPENSPWNGVFEVGPLELGEYTVTVTAINGEGAVARDSIRVHSVFRLGYEATATPSLIPMGGTTWLSVMDVIPPMPVSADEMLPSTRPNTTYLWQEIEGPAEIAFSNPRSETTEASGFSIPGNYTFQVTVMEDDRYVERVRVSVFVEVASGFAATATPSTVTVGEETMLQIIPGEGYNGGRLSWEQVSGPGTATLTLSPFDIFPSIYVATFDTAGSYVLRVTVSDSGGLVETREVTVEVTSGFVVEITWPADGYELVSAGIQEPLTVVVRAADPTHGVKEVELAVNGIVFDTRKPNVSLWTGVFEVGPLELGEYTVTVTAINGEGMVARDSIRVHSVYRLYYEATATPSQISVGGTTELRVMGLAAPMPLSVDEMVPPAWPSSTYLWEKIEGPAEIAFSNPRSHTTEASGFSMPGNYMFQVTVTEDDGYSEHVWVSVYVEPRTLYSVAITSPADGATVSADSDVVVNVDDGSDAMDAIPDEVKLLILKNGSEVASAEALAWGAHIFDLGTDLRDVNHAPIVLTAGTYTLRAQAHGADQGQYGDDEITIAVEDVYSNPGGKTGRDRKAEGCGIASTTGGSSTAVWLVVLVALGLVARRRQLKHF